LSASPPTPSPPTEALIFDAIRTPRGRGRATGSLYGIKPVSMVVGLIADLRARHPGLDPSTIDDLVMGIVTPVGDQGACLPRTAVMAAGLPDTIGGLQINRFCGSGLEAVNIAAQKVRSGWDDLVLAGGVESMSRVPLGRDGGPWMHDPETNAETSFIYQGVAADLIATIEGFDRGTVDRYAARSQQRAAAAWTGGYFAKSVVPVRDRNGATVLDCDEHMRPESTETSLGRLPPSFAAMGEQGGFDAVALQRYHWIERIDHVHHAGNSSGIVDGAALVLIGNEQVGRRQGLVPRGRIVATATSGADPTIMLTGPTPATKKLLSRVGLNVGDIDLFEINEAFAAIPLKYAKDLGIPEDKINVNGGAIAMGHPLGATGSMLIGTALDELERRDADRAVVTLCIGAGMGVATLIERV
jgi:acetyl-CoA C-acetyltransferase